MDYIVGNNGLEMTQTLKCMQDYRYYVLGFGLAVSGMTLIPMLNFFTLNGAVIGATLL